MGFGYYVEQYNPLWGMDFKSLIEAAPSWEEFKSNRKWEPYWEKKDEEPISPDRFIEHLIGDMIQHGCVVAKHNKELMSPCIQRTNLGVTYITFLNANILYRERWGYHRKLLNLADFLTTWNDTDSFVIGTMRQPEWKDSPSYRPYMDYVQDKEMKNIDYSLWTKKDLKEFESSGVLIYGPRQAKRRIRQIIKLAQIWGVCAEPKKPKHKSIPLPPPPIVKDSNPYIWPIAAIASIVGVLIGFKFLS